MLDFGNGYDTFGAPELVPQAGRERSVNASTPRRPGSRG